VSWTIGVLWYTIKSKEMLLSRYVYYV